MGKKKAKKQPRWGFTEAGGFIATSALTSAVVQLLRSTATQKINFLFNAIIVTGARFLEVARAIEQFEIIVYHDTKCAKAPTPDDAYYSATDDAVYLGYKDLSPIENRMLT